MRRFATWDELCDCEGQDIGWSDEVHITQEQIDGFAHATGDHQWIHVDPERARNGPFGSTVAHGFLTLSLLPHFFSTAYQVQSPSMGVNYGLNKVRFMSPVPVGARLRALLHLLAWEPLQGDAVQLTWRVSVFGHDPVKPVCVAEYLVRRYPLPPTPAP